MRAVFSTPPRLLCRLRVTNYSVSARLQCDGRPRIVVLGSGWGGFAFAKNVDTKKFDVTVVSPRNHMLFTPLLASTSVGTLDFRSIAEPVRASLRDVKFEQGKCRGIDTVNKTVDIHVHYGAVRGGVEDVGSDMDKRTHTLSYDALVIAVGARNNTFNIPGVSENAMFLKELSDARNIRTTIIRNIEAASFPSVPADERERLLSFVVVGGGPTGVEFAAELHDFLRQDIRRMYPDLYPFIRIRVIEGKEILSMFDTTLRNWAKRRLGSEGVDVITGASVTRLDPSIVHLQDGCKFPYGLCVWSTGVAPRKVTAMLDPLVFSKDKAGRLNTDGHLRVLHTSIYGESKPLEGVFALGDCADVAGINHPATAQVAEQQGVYLAKALNVAGGLDITQLPAFEYRHKGTLAYLGEYGAVSDFTQVKESRGPLAVLSGQRVKGIVSWLIWRSAYLTKLGSWRNRLQVPVDWARTLLFGRDISNF